MDESVPSFPKRYLIGMVIISLISSTGEGTVTVFGGPISIPILILSFLIVTAIPMLFLISKDMAALRDRGVVWNQKSRWFYYVLTVLLPAWLMTIIYWFRRNGKIEAYS